MITEGAGLRGHSRRPINPAAPEYLALAIEHDCLSWGNGPLGFSEGNLDTTIRQGDDHGFGLWRTAPDASFADQRISRGTLNPIEIPGDEIPAQQVRLGTDPYDVG